MCDEDGLATLELALMLPWVLILFFGAVTVAQGFHVRHALRAKAGELAHVCALAGITDSDACAQQAVQVLQQTELPSWAYACQDAGLPGRVEVTATVTPLTLVGGHLMTMRMPSESGSHAQRYRLLGAEGRMTYGVLVELVCAYGGWMALGGLLSQVEMPADLFSTTITARASMPFVTTRFEL